MTGLCYCLLLQEIKISKKRLTLDWSIKARIEDFKPTLIRHRKYLVDNGFRSSTRDSYVGNVGRFLEFAQSENFRLPTAAIVFLGVDIIYLVSLVGLGQLAEENKLACHLADFLVELEGMQSLRYQDNLSKDEECTYSKLMIRCNRYSFENRTIFLINSE